MGDRSPKPRLDVENFPATVLFMDWVRMPDGRPYLSARGTTSVMSAEDAVGFVPTGHNSANWIARIAGPTVSLTLMGCQVRAVLEGPPHELAKIGEYDCYVVP